MADFFVLGAPDPEMTRIAALLKREKKNFIFAKKDGARVHPSHAYDSDNGNEISQGARVIFIECAVGGVTPAFRIDHHRPGDPGYDKCPKDYWEGSSLGQLHTYLGIASDEQDKVIAAIDHCFNAAMKGLCPGVSTESALNMRLREIAQSFECSTDAVKKEIGRFQNMLKEVPIIQMGEQVVYDIRENVGIGYAFPYLSALVAAVLDGKAILLRKGEHKGKAPQKFVLSGDVSEDTVQYFMEIWAPTYGLTNIYGAPSRGYAGGYRF